jgi:hypothetical protein
VEWRRGKSVQRRKDWREENGGRLQYQHSGNYPPPQNTLQPACDTPPPHFAIARDHLGSLNLTLGPVSPGRRALARSQRLRACRGHRSGCSCGTATRESPALYSLEALENIQGRVSNVLYCQSFGLTLRLQELDMPVVAVLDLDLDQYGKHGTNHVTFFVLCSEIVHMVSPLAPQQTTLTGGTKFLGQLAPSVRRQGRGHRLHRSGCRCGAAEWEHWGVRTRKEVVKSCWHERGDFWEVSSSSSR